MLSGRRYAVSNNITSIPSEIELMTGLEVFYEAKEDTAVLDVKFSIDCPEYSLTVDAMEWWSPLQAITFLYHGSDCAQGSSGLRSTYNTCEDDNGGPSTALGSKAFITAVSAERNDLYFAGIVAAGDKYTLNADKFFDVLSDRVTIQIFSSQGGTLLQTVDFDVSCCSLNLFRFDYIGANQITGFIETSGDISGMDSTPRGSIASVINPTIDIQFIVTTKGTVPLRILEAFALTSVQEDSIDYTRFVAGKIVAPGVFLEVPRYQIPIVNMEERTRYTFFITVIGETLDGGEMVNDFDSTECTVGFNIFGDFSNSTI
jgi:hypothetical protein